MYLFLYIKDQRSNSLILGSKQGRVIFIFLLTLAPSHFLSPHIKIQLCMSESISKRCDDKVAKTELDYKVFGH